MYRLYKQIQHLPSTGVPKRDPGYGPEGLDKETIYFNFRLDIGITEVNDMDEFISVTKHEGQRK